MKKLVVFCAIASMSLALVGHPPPPHRGPMMHGPRIHHAPPPPPRHHHYHHGGAFWTGVSVGLVGSLVVPPSHVVIQAAPNRVWVPPVYGERPIYRAGIYVGIERYVITPGYWAPRY